MENMEFRGCLIPNDRLLHIADSARCCSMGYREILGALAPAVLGLEHRRPDIFGDHDPLSPLPKWPATCTTEGKIST